MKSRKRFRISIEDESRLQNIASFSFSPLKIAMLIFGAILSAIILGFLFVLLTPAKNLIPGYFRPDRRAATEQALLRVDSIAEAYRANEAYIANLREIFDTDRHPADTVAVGGNTASFSPDSLLPASGEESRFAAMMQEREKFNIVKASMAAEGMLFYPVSEEGVTTAASRNSFTAHIAIPQGASVMAMADGAVLASYYDPASRGYAVIIQHDNGFVSRYSALGSPLAAQSETIAGGNIIALAPTAPAGRPAEIIVEMWHNGIPVKPYQYFSSHRRLQTPEPDFPHGSALESSLGNNPSDNIQ